ncbi:MAG: ester cyclase [Halorientalis sp.]
MSPNETPPRRVAIACQGGGSHTAFTAGVLDRLLSEDEVEYDIVGFSGTSGGAICAFAAWFGLASQGRDEGRAKSRRLLAQIWDDLEADSLFDTMVNAIGVSTVRAQGFGVPLPAVSPYVTPGSEWGRKVLRETLEDAIGPDELASVVNRSEPVPPRLDIGAVDVQRGSFRSFTEREVSYDAVLASAAVPNLFQAAPVIQPDGTTRYYWDGLFSQNPPLGNLFSREPSRLDPPDELWIVQINPQREESIPTDLEAIADRRNELGGNLSVNQELEFIRQLNEWHATGALEDVYQPIEVKTINLDESVASPDRPFDYATKLDRAPRFLELLWDHGREQAERFLATERDRRHVRETVEATWTTDRSGNLDEWVLPSYEAHFPTSLVNLRNYLQDDPSKGPGTFDLEDVLEFRALLQQAVPDLVVEVEEMVAQPNAVATRWKGTGTHTGTFLGIEPTEDTVTISGMRIDPLRDGRLAESWILLEQWSLLRQLSVAETATPVSTTSRMAATPVVTQLSAPAENEELTRSLVTDVWNNGRREYLDAVVGDSEVMYLDGQKDLVGPEAYWEFVSNYREAFPDLELTIEDTVSEGDKIVVRKRLRGTHEGQVFGVDATGNRVDVTRMVIHHIDDGRIVETGMVEDTMGLLQQLEVRPEVIEV